MKTCKKCGAEKENDSFHKSKIHGDGLFPYCKDCHKEYVRNRNRRLAKALNEKRRAEYKNSPEKQRAKSNAYYHRNRIKVLEKQTKYRGIYRRANLDKFRMYESQRRLASKWACPKWASKKEIERIYELAREMERSAGTKFHVDHIVPLRSKIVCGLHCEHNLQILGVVENIAKGNRTWPDMPEQENQP